MKIRGFVWPKDRVDHIAGHGLTPKRLSKFVSERRRLFDARSPKVRTQSIMSLDNRKPERYLFCVVIQLPDGKAYPVTARPMTNNERRRYQQWANLLNIADMPQTDSIQELARFWDTHDLTDFEDQLEEVSEPVFEREAVVKVQLEPEEIEALDEIAKSRGLDSAGLIREWVLERIHTL